MKMEEILKLIEAVSASTLTEFKYEENGTKLNLKKEQQKVEIVQNAEFPVVISRQLFFHRTWLYPEVLRMQIRKKILKKNQKASGSFHLWLELSTLHRQRMHQVLSRLVTRSKSDRLSES